VALLLLVEGAREATQSCRRCLNAKSIATTTTITMPAYQRTNGCRCIFDQLTTRMIVPTCESEKAWCYGVEKVLTRTQYSYNPSEREHAHIPTYTLTHVGQQ